VAAYPLSAPGTVYKITVGKICHLTSRVKALEVVFFPGGLVCSVPEKPGRSGQISPGQQKQVTA
ncbi:MAG: hypothetical protein LBU84_08425, partial [Prevotella sp.]|nr:hypothetical protein [Prevotella sp.]